MGNICFKASATQEERSPLRPKTAPPSPPREPRRGLTKYQNPSFSSSLALPPATRSSQDPDPFFGTFLSAEGPLFVSVTNEEGEVLIQARPMCESVNHSTAFACLATMKQPPKELRPLLDRDRLLQGEILFFPAPEGSYPGAEKLYCIVVGTFFKPIVNPRTKNAYETRRHAFSFPVMQPEPQEGPSFSFKTPEKNGERLILTFTKVNEVGVKKILALIPSQGGGEPKESPAAAAPPAPQEPKGSHDGVVQTPSRSSRSRGRARVVTLPPKLQQLRYACETVALSIEKLNKLFPSGLLDEEPSAEEAARAAAPAAAPFARAASESGGAVSFGGELREKASSPHGSDEE